MAKVYVIVFILFWNVLFSCKKPPSYNSVPNIQYVSIDTNFVKILQPDESVEIKIYFEDGEGDLDKIYYVGSRNPSLEKDTALAPTLIPKGGIDDVNGFLLLYKKIDFCLSPPYDTVVYDIFVTDKAGHRSNTIKTDSIYIDCR